MPASNAQPAARMRTAVRAGVDFDAPQHPHASFSCNLADGEFVRRGAPAPAPSSVHAPFRRACRRFAARIDPRQQGARRV
ncbi:hypothetical protein [Burkholderia pseudomallei]|uniref:hypothetical protein n=1 Tax=Burkholderia pseudomallei TaxID=28450 RepID=UPI0005729F85|nr:hypothetical protein [Burkholderia pseudomallei]RAQ85791.1 hypothetical protein A4G86_04735 [Burkholderia pseudomallei]